MAEVPMNIHRWLINWLYASHCGREQLLLCREVWSWSKGLCPPARFKSTGRNSYLPWLLLCLEIKLHWNRPENTLETTADNHVLCCCSLCQKKPEVIDINKQACVRPIYWTHSNLWQLYNEFSKLLKLHKDSYIVLEMLFTSIGECSTCIHYMVWVHSMLDFTYIFSPCTDFLKLYS